MKFRREKTEDLDVNLTPLIDVVFLLLIFFMVSTTFQRESQISVQLPKAAKEPVDIPAEKIEIVINATGQFFVNEQELIKSDANALISALNNVTAGNRDIPLTIRADSNTPHQAVVTAMDAAAQLGLNRMSIATSFKK